MISILINNVETKIGEELPEDIKSLVIVKHPMIQIPIAHHQVQQVTDWLYEASQRAAHISYNGVIMGKESVNKYVKGK